MYLVRNSVNMKQLFQQRNIFSSCLRPYGCRSLSSYLHQRRQYRYKNGNKRFYCATAKKTLPSEAQVVVCGGGVIGVSVALHLAMDGWKEVVLVEQGSLTCGTTWHGAGLLGRLKSTGLSTDVACYSRKLYKQLEEEDELYTGWKQCGALYLARTKDRMVAYTRYLQSSRLYGVTGEVISPREVKELAPLLNTDDLEGAVWVPEDGVVSAPDVALAMARKAKQLGVDIFERTQVQRVNTHSGEVTSVTTDRGDIKCQIFVNCAGIWARELGQLCDVPVKVPLHPCEHFYLVTKPIDGMDKNMPVIRDYDGYVYLREWSGGIMGGGFEPVAKPVFDDGIPPGFEFQLLPEDWDHFQVLMDQMLHRVPVMSQSQVRQLVNGPESFTPDGKYVMGESPEVQNYFMLAGMNSAGIQLAGGLGKYLSEWITHAEPSKDLWSFDVRRFVDLHNNKKFLRERVKETLGMKTECSYWDLVAYGYAYCRTLRTSPIYTRMEQTATWGQFMGYERPLYFKPELSDAEEWEASGMSITRNDFRSHDYISSTEKPRGAFGKPEWFDNVKSEYWACREGVCLIDMSTFTKFELSSAGTEVVDFLEYVCSNEVDKPVGTVIHTGMQNKYGGFENDCSVVRTAENRYFMISPTAQQTRSLAWINEHMPKDGSVQINDVTSMYTAINVIGPKAPELLSELTDTSLDKVDFPHMTCKFMDVGQASNIKAMRLTHSGEEGWILYIPSEYALHVYDSLMAVGKNYGIRNAGYYALRALRTEKFFAYWGTDLTPRTTPLECGREFRVKFHRPGFIGYEALLKQKEEGIRKRLVQFLVEDHDVNKDTWPWGGEPVYRNGKYCGTTTSTAFGYTLNKHICLAYVRDIDDTTGQERVLTNNFVLDRDAKYEVNIAGHVFPLKANIYPPKLASAAIII